MTTNFASKTLIAIRKDKAARLSQLAERGIRDEVTAMIWPSGLIEISGETVRGQCGTGRSQATIKEWIKTKFGTGNMKAINRGEIQGRETITYEIR